MLSPKICAVILAFSSSIAIAAPAVEVSPNAVYRRTEPQDGPGSRKQPKNLQISTKNWRTLSEANCYNMLCVQRTDIYQRGPNSEYGEDEYTKAGAKNQPFQSDDKLKQYGTSRATDQTTSPEDFPWRSIVLQPGMKRTLTGGPQGEQSVQGGCITNAYQGHYGGDVIGFDEWFEINYLAEDAPFGPICQAWLRKDTSICPEDQLVAYAGRAAVALATMIYYYQAGRYFHASTGKGKREVDSINWDNAVETRDVEWPEVPADAEVLKREVVVYDEDGNVLRRSETQAKAVKREIVQLDEAGNELSTRGTTVQLDEAGNELSEREVVQLDAAGNELTGSKVKAVKRGVTVVLDADGNELTS